MEKEFSINYESQLFPHVASCLVTVIYETDESGNYFVRCYIPESVPEKYHAAIEETAKENFNSWVESERNKIMDQYKKEYERLRPVVLRCHNPETCNVEHNPCGDENHHYGCGCNVCMNYYYTKLK